MSEYTRKQIMEENRHQFIYSYNTEGRHRFLKDLERTYPILTDSTAPVAIYMEDFYLPLSKPTNEDINSGTVRLIADQFLDFSISENIIRRILEQEKINTSMSRINNLLERINRLYGSKKHQEARSLEELKSILEESRKMYSNYYVEYLQGDQSWFNPNSLRIPFINAVDVARKTKEALNITSYYGLIFEADKKMPLVSHQAINGFVTRRCNGDLSIKVATNPASWPTFYDLNGTLAENIHDYGTIETDDSYKVYTKQIQQSEIKGE